MALSERDHAVEQAQDSFHGEGHDYTIAPHLRHVNLRRRIDNKIERSIAEVIERQGNCSVLEVGAGHGFFTDTVRAAGGEVTVTEMSAASADVLAERFRDDPAVKVIYDADGNASFETGKQYDLVLLIAVIHHVPDYVDLVSRLCDSVLRPGAVVITFADPLWYPRMTRWARIASWGTYFAWRLTQGKFRRGLATRWRRLRGVYSDSEPSDLVEYHVVRQGVDEIALQEVFRARFADVELDSYFSTGSARLQALGEKHLPPNNFGIVARGRNS